MWQAGPVFCSFSRWVLALMDLGTNENEATLRKMCVDGVCVSATQEMTLIVLFGWETAGAQRMAHCLASSEVVPF